MPIVVAVLESGNPPALSTTNDEFKKYESTESPVLAMPAVDPSAPLVIFAEVEPAPAPTKSVVPVENLYFPL